MDSFEIPKLTDCKRCEDRADRLASQFIEAMSDEGQEMMIAVGLKLAQYAMRNSHPDAPWMQHWWIKEVCLNRTNFKVCGVDGMTPLFTESS